jgi:16S rRNA processing protein RimM
MPGAEDAPGAPPDTSDDVTIGRIGPARGVRGDAYVEPWTDDPADRFAVGSVLRTDPASAGPLTVTAQSMQSGKLVVHFAGIDTREAIEAVRGVQIVMSAADRPPLEDPDEFYDTDLVGLAVRTVEGAHVGAVREVVHAGASDYLVVDVDGRECLVPFVSAIVPTVDVTAGVVVIDPPEGLLEL